MKKIILAGMVAMSATTASASVGDALKIAGNTVWYGALCGFTASLTGCEKFDGVNREKTLNYYVRDTYLKMLKKGDQIQNCKDAGYDAACRNLGIVPEGEE